MSNKILVAYATRGGSTLGVAEAIAHTLAQDGFEVVVRAVQDVVDLTPYSAVVVGSAIHDKKWLPEAMQFVINYRAALRQKPFAAFLVCMTLALNNDDWRQEAHVEDWLGPIRAVVKPISEGLFAGTLDISSIPSFGDRIKFRASVISGVWSEGDHRDWEAIETWAHELSPKFQLA